MPGPTSVSLKTDEGIQGKGCQIRQGSFSLKNKCPGWPVTPQQPGQSGKETSLLSSQRHFVPPALLWATLGLMSLRLCAFVCTLSFSVRVQSSQELTDREGRYKNPERRRN